MIRPGIRVTIEPKSGYADVPGIWKVWGRSEQYGSYWVTPQSRDAREWASDLGWYHNVHLSRLRPVGPTRVVILAGTLEP